MIRLLAALTCVTLMAAPALAQEALPTPRQAMAKLIHEAMVPSSMASYGYGWDAVSIRISRHMHWHLAPPDPRGRAPGSDVRRNGWIDAEGASVSVSAHGVDETVESLGFELGRWLRTGNDDEAVAALKAAGVTATPRAVPQNSATRALGVASMAAWDLAADGREPAHQPLDALHASGQRRGAHVLGFV